MYLCHSHIDVYIFSYQDKEDPPTTRTADLQPNTSSQQDPTPTCLPSSLGTDNHTPSQHHPRTSTPRTSTWGVHHCQRPLPEQQPPEQQPYTTQPTTQPYTTQVNCHGVVASDCCYVIISRCPLHQGVRSNWCGILHHWGNHASLTFTHLPTRVPTRGEFKQLEAMSTTPSYHQRQPSVMCVRVYACVWCGVCVCVCVCVVRVRVRVRKCVCKSGQ